MQEVPRRTWQGRNTFWKYMKAPVFITLPCATTVLEVTPTFAFSLILTPFAKRGIESCKIQLLQQVVLSALKCYFWKDIEIYDKRCSLHPLAITGSRTWTSCYHTPARFQNHLLIKTLINRTHLSQTQIQMRANIWGEHDHGCRRAEDHSENPISTFVTWFLSQTPQKKLLTLKVFGKGKKSNVDIYIFSKFVNRW